ncbi:MAG: hypothetical protein ABI858_00895 [Pseudoxanthomonas sp.]
MSADLLFSLHRLLSWLLAFLMALLPQYVIAKLGEADGAVATYTTMADTGHPPAMTNATIEPPASNPPAVSASGHGTRPPPQN